MIDYIIGGLLAIILVYSVIRIIKRIRSGSCIGCSGCSVQADKDSNQRGCCGDRQADR